MPSASLEPDVLTLWRLYAKGDSVIAFDPQLGKQNNFAWHVTTPLGTRLPAVGFTCLRDVTYGAADPPDIRELTRNVRDFPPGKGGKTFTDAKLIPMAATIKMKPSLMTARSKYHLPGSDRDRCSAA